MKYTMDGIKKSIRKNLLERTSKMTRPTIDVEDVNIEDTHHNEEITLMLHQVNMLNEKVGYLTNINGDLIEFLHTLVKSLDHNNDIDISDARKDFTILLNRSGRRKFYQQQKRL